MYSGFSLPEKGQILTTSKIDFAGVGARTSLNPPAARMRYTRLKRAIESGTLIGTQGKPFTGSKKRKNGERDSTSILTSSGGDSGTTTALDTAGDVTNEKRMVGSGKGHRRSLSAEDTKDGGTDSDEDSDPENDLPLAKRRRFAHNHPLLPILPRPQPSKAAAPAATVLTSEVINTPIKPEASSGEVEVPSQSKCRAGTSPTGTAGGGQLFHQAMEYEGLKIETPDVELSPKSLPKACLLVSSGERIDKEGH